MDKKLNVNRQASGVIIFVQISDSKGSAVFWKMTKFNENKIIP